MNERIRELAKLTLEGKMYAEPAATEFDREDLFLSRQKRESKQLCEYILNQRPVLTKYSKMTGFFNCDASVVGDAFRRKGHRTFAEMEQKFYLKPIENLSTFEWQHATADYKKVLKKGIKGIIEEVEASLVNHTEPEKVEFLNALKDIANALIGWAHKCSDEAKKLAEKVEEPEYKQNLNHLSKALLNVPENKPSCFYEAVLTIYICFATDPDSVGTLDRYLTPFYEEDLREGILTREEAKEYLQELFLMLQAATHITSPNFTRGGESHFCVGGYLPNGEDGFNDLSKLILESLLELPTWIPQVTFRWTAKTPKELFQYILDCERKDPNKRIAFQNDEKRIKSYTEICKIPYEQAVGYTTVGCNEPAFPGVVAGGTSYVNVVRSVDLVFRTKTEEILAADSFDAFYNIYIKQLFADIDAAYEYDNKYTLARARDISYMSSLFFEGCIEKAVSLTQGASNTAIASLSHIGIPNVIDSLIIVKQFVYDEKIITMQELIDALHADWIGYEDLRILILNKGDFFGNDTDRSNEVAARLYQSLYEFLKDKTNVFGFHWLIGDLTGYNAHPKWFGENLGATPDGRKAGDALKFGLGQSEGKDRNGLSALLNSIAKADPTGIGCGSTVTNLMIDEQLIKNDEYFEKMVTLLETYFKNGGVHFQLTYVSKEDLIHAKATPEDYKNLRVRVSGFSDYFVKLNDTLQDDIIERTTQK